MPLHWCCRWTLLHNKLKHYKMRRCTWTRSIVSRCYPRIQQWLHCLLQWGRLTKADLSENCWNLKYKIYFICHKHFLFIKTLSHKLFPHLHISVMTYSVFANWQQLVDNARVSLPIFPVAPKQSLLKTLNLLILYLCSFLLLHFTMQECPC